MPNRKTGRYLYSHTWDVYTWDVKSIKIDKVLDPKEDLVLEKRNIDHQIFNKLIVKMI